MKRFLPILCMTLFLLGMAKVPAAEGAVMYSISLDGTDVGLVNPIETPETGAQYYGFTLPGYGTPAFGAEANKGFVWLHRNTLTGDISIGLIQNKQGGGNGSMRVTFGGLPVTASLDLKDDPTVDTYSLTPPSAVFNWAWGGYSDGAVVGGLNGLWEITLTPSNVIGISSWDFVSGSDGSGRIALDLSKTLQIKPVPIPSSIIILVSGLIGLAGLRRKSGQG